MGMIHKFSLNDINIALDVNSGAVHVLDNEAYDVLDYYKDKNIDEIADILKNKYSKEKIVEAYNEMKTLEKEGLLYSNDEYEYHPSFINRKPVVKALCLHMAHDCNLKCKYCFASQGDFGGERKLMSYEVGKKSLDYLLENSGNKRNLEVDFFGGEPLMNWEVVKKLVEYGNEEAEKKGKVFRFTITTNGVLLDDEKIEYINKHMHNVVLSLDGRKEINDEMRLTLNDKGSYDVIVPKFKKLVDSRAKDKYYYVRGTFTRKNLDFSKDVLHFADLGFDLTSVEPVVDSDNNPYALKEEDIPKIFEEYEKLADEYANRKIKGDNFTFFHYMIDLDQGPCVIKRLTGCGAGCEYMAVTPEGDLYPCHQFVGNEDFKLGNILDENLSIPRDIQLKFQNAHVYAKEECRNCWAKFYCSGGCHANAHNFNNDLLKPYELGCKMQRKRTECAIMVKAKIMLEESKDD
ncbi:thioether cross-link-forming SCIFF peptide maturase [Tepidibacter sp. Z1-5]|uniref:thioether cross-link-forming SCIFF peptide maturase n=1 Tax=Tepidibacter sp. Z1-5 TaxID=3134138 RepID=UPI0030C2A4AF